VDTENAGNTVGFWSGSMLLCFTGGQFVCAEKYYQDPQVFRLLDGKTPAGQYKGYARTIVFSSPAAKKWNEYTKTAWNMR
jgi:hypothetical protein